MWSGWGPAVQVSHNSGVSGGWPPPLTPGVGMDMEMGADKPLFMAVCNKCGARCFVPVPDPEPGQLPKSKEAVHPAKRKVRWTCLRCGHEQFTKHWHSLAAACLRDANEAIHPMSGTHVCSRFGWLGMPLIDGLRRYPASERTMATRPKES